MIRIALCDDNEKELNLTASLIRQCQIVKNGIYDVKVDCYHDGNSLLAAMKTEQSYDLIILDVIMPELYGTETARYIFETNKVPCIIFLTSSPEYAVESYDVDALDYILKPVTLERLEVSFKKFTAKYKSLIQNEIIIRDKTTLTRIALHTLCYVESIDHQLVYHISDGQQITCRQNLRDVEQILIDRNCFIKPNRSYIINMDYIAQIDGECITLKNGDKIYSSRARTRELSDMFLKYKFTKGEPS